MIISAIAAIDRAGLIGIGPKMPWHLPRDLRQFRKLTLKKPIIMGRRTLDSLSGPLPERLNIILTRSHSLRVEGCRIATSIHSALDIAQEYNSEHGIDEVMIIGGGEIFNATTDNWDRLYLTVVEGDFAGDTFFPLERIRDIGWQLISSEFCESDVKNPFSHWFLTLQRPPSDLAQLRPFDLIQWLHSASPPGEVHRVKTCLPADPMDPAVV